MVRSSTAPATTCVDLAEQIPPTTVAHGDGLDADSLLTREPLTRDLDPDLVDGVLALLLGYFTWAAGQDPVETSPYLRTHQAWYRDASSSWLSARRGWALG